LIDIQNLIQLQADILEMMNLYALTEIPEMKDLPEIDIQEMKDLPEIDIQEMKDLPEIDIQEMKDLPETDIPEMKENQKCIL
jgi:hypothetical protein